MTFGGNGTSTSMSKEEQAQALEAVRNANRSISRMSNEEWRARFEKDGTVDLWLEDEFNAGSRLIVSGSAGLLGAAYVLMRVTTNACAVT